MAFALHYQRSVGSQMGSAIDIRSLSEERTRRYSDSYANFDDENVFPINGDSPTNNINSTLESAGSLEDGHANGLSVMTADRSLNTTNSSNTIYSSPSLYLNCSEGGDRGTLSTVEEGDLAGAFAFASRMFYAHDEYAPPSTPHSTVTETVKPQATEHRRVEAKASAGVEESCLLDLDSGRISGELNRVASGVVDNRRREHGETTDGCVSGNGIRHTATEKNGIFSTISFAYDHHPHTVTLLADRYCSIRQACLTPMQQNVKRVALVPSNYASILRDATNTSTTTEVHRLQRVYALKDALNSTQMPVRVDEVRFPRILGKHPNALAAVVQSALCEGGTTEVEEAEKKRRAAARAAEAAAATQPLQPRRRGRPRRVSRRSSADSDDSLTRRQQLADMCAKPLRPAVNARHRITIARTPLIDQPLKRQPPDANGFFAVSTSLAKNNQWLILTSSTRKSASDSAIASQTDDFRMSSGSALIGNHRQPSPRVSDAWSLRSAGSIGLSSAEAENAALLAASTPDASFAADGMLQTDLASRGVAVKSGYGTNGVVNNASNKADQKQQKLANINCTMALSPAMNRSKFLPPPSRQTATNETCDSSSGCDDSYYSTTLDEVMANLEPQPSAPPPVDSSAAPAATQQSSSLPRPQAVYPQPTVAHPSHHLFYSPFMPYGYYPMMTMPYPTSASAPMPMPPVLTPTSQAVTASTALVSTTGKEAEATVGRNVSAKETTLVEEHEGETTKANRATESILPNKPSASFASLNTSSASSFAAVVTPTDDPTRCICVCECRVCADNAAEIKRLEDTLSKARSDSTRLRHAHHAVRNNTISAECAFRIAVITSSEAGAIDDGVAVAPPPEIASMMMTVFGASAAAKKEVSVVEKTATIEKGKIEEAECGIVKLDDQLVKKIVENIRSEKWPKPAIVTAVKAKPQTLRRAKTTLKAEQPQSKPEPVKTATVSRYASPLQRRMLQRENTTDELAQQPTVKQVKFEQAASQLPEHPPTKTNVTGVGGATKNGQKLVVTVTDSSDTNKSDNSSSKSGHFIRKVVIDEDIEAFKKNRTTVASGEKCVTYTSLVVTRNEQTTTEEDNSDSDQMDALGDLLSPITTSPSIDDADMKANKMAKRAAKKRWRADEIVLSDDDKVCSVIDDDDTEWKPSGRRGGSNPCKSHSLGGTVKREEGTTKSTRKTTAKRNASTRKTATKRSRRRNVLMTEVDALSLGWSDLSADEPPELDAVGEAEVEILSDEVEESAAKLKRNASHKKQKNTGDTNVNKKRTRKAASNERAKSICIDEEMDDNVAPQLTAETEYVRRKLAVVHDRYVPFRPLQRQPTAAKRKSPLHQTSTLFRQVPSPLGAECDDERVKRARVAHWVEQSTRQKKHN